MTASPRSFRRLAAAALAVIVGATSALVHAAEAGAAEPPVDTPAAAVAPSAAATPEEGVWVRREVDFTYLGFTSYYSCESLAGKLRSLLRLAGARPDLRVVPSGCAFGANQVSPFPRARMTFWTFVPADRVPAAPEPKPEAPAKQLGRDAPKLKRGDRVEPEPGLAAWRTVEIDGRRSREIDGGDCEVVEQFVREVLPLFATRDVEDRVRCTPRQVSPFAVQLKFDVLGPLPDADAQARGGQSPATSPTASAPRQP